ncbi:MAG: T9SS type A sorting domain-containing protein [Salinivirgaceae bacterium]|jgi:hypothetical protein
MKTLFLISLFALVSFVAKATTFQWGDTTVVELITFESQSTYFVQGTPTTNIWQIGQPSKTLFNEAFNGANAIVTDTLNPYPVNNHSWFDLVLPIYDFGYPYVGIEFMNKLNTTSNCDGGYVTVSYDQGETWINIIEDTISFSEWYITPTFPWQTINLYSKEDTLYNGEYGFSGESLGWEKVQFSWYTMIVKKGYWYDTMIVRFNFISDTIPDNKDGWMIDNIRLFWVDLGGSIHESAIVSNLDVFPNPINDRAIIRTKNQQNIKKIEVFSINGQLVGAKIVQSNEYQFHKDNLQPGIYFMKCTFNNETSETIKLLVQ